MMDEATGAQLRDEREDLGSDPGPSNLPAYWPSRMWMHNPLPAQWDRDWVTKRSTRVCLTVVVDRLLRTCHLCWLPI